MEKYETYLYVQISQTKQPVALSGINLYKEKEEWKIPAYAECHEYMLSFNGNGDLVVFAISDKSYYTPFARPVDLKNFYTTNRMIEFFIGKVLLLYLPVLLVSHEVCWFGAVQWVSALRKDRS